MDNPTLRAALEYHARGWSLIPLRVDEEKKPAVKWGPYQTHLADESQLNEWFGNGSNYGLAVVFGSVSGGLGARDFDEMAAYQNWAAENPELAGTLPTVATHRGRHVYFRMTREQESAVRQSLGKDNGKGAIQFEDGELRIGVGSYVALPPSPHPKGGNYEWLKPPKGEIPIVDVLQAGLLKGSVCHRVSREKGVNRECPQNTHDTLCSQVSLSTPNTLCHESVEQAVEWAIESTMPDGFQQRHALLFQFARILKAIPALTDQTAKELKPYARQWHEKAKPFLTKPFEETWLDFAEGWESAKFAYGEGPVDMAFQRVLESDLPEVALEYEGTEIRQLVGLCRELQRAVGPDNNFFLAVRVGSRLLGKSWPQVARYLRLLRRDEIIKLMEPGSVSARKAHRYRYLKEL